jgi:aromatic-L-amino-acid decarboxylase
MIRRHVALTQELAEHIVQDERFEILAPHPLTLVCLALRAGDPDANTATERLVEAANATGNALFTRTVLDGRSAIRVSVGAQHTERHHVEAGWALLHKLA